MKISRYFLVFLTVTSLTCATLKKSYPDVHINADIHFWAGQMAEHAQFAYDLTADLSLKDEGKMIEKQFKDFLKRYGHSQDEQRDQQKQFLNLSNEIKQYQEKVRQALKKAGDTDKIKFALLTHMDEETDYAQKKARGHQLSKKEEAKFWGQEHQEEAETMAALIKPNEKPLIDRAKDIAHQLKNKKLEVVIKANEELDKLGKRLDQAPGKSNIPAKLAAHEERERKYAAKILERMEKAS